MEKEEEVDRRRGGKTTSKSEQDWNLSAHLGQLETEQNRKGLCKVICGAPMTMQAYGID